jgi:hypothetical protein
MHSAASKEFGFHRMRSVLYGAALLFLAAVICTRGLFLWIEYQHAVERAEAASRDVAVILEEHARRTFETGDLIAENALEFVTGHGGVEGVRDNYQAHLFLNKSADRTIGSSVIWIIDATGRPAVMSNFFPTFPFNLTDRFWWKAHALEGTDRYVGPALLGRLMTEIFYTYSRRIIGPDGVFQGVVLIALRPTFFQKIALTTDFGQDAIFAMMRSDGHIIARTNLRADQIGATVERAPIFTDFVGKATGTYRGRSILDDQDKIMSFRRLPEWSVVVATSIPMRTALAVWWQSLYWSLAILTLVLAGVGWFVWMGLRVSRSEERAQEALATALADKDVLFQEVHHRIKNNLQSSAALLSIQERRFKDPEVKAAFRETGDRMMSIALVHEMLYRTNSAANLDLSEYLAGLVRGLAESYGAERRGIVVKTDLESESLALDLERAIPVALVLTEVLTNAFKHAFP